MQKHWRFIFYVICIVIVLPALGCAGSYYKNYGSIKPDGNALKAFEAYQVNPHYRYYISGSDLYPHVIMGLDKTYTLEPDLWKPIEMTPEKLRELVTDMYHRIRNLNVMLSLYGFALLDDKGKQIGAWYSILEATTTLKMKDDHTVIIITPPIDTYLKYEDR